MAECIPLLLCQYGLLGHSHFEIEPLPQVLLAALRLPRYDDPLPAPPQIPPPFDRTGLVGAMMKSPKEMVCLSSPFSHVQGDLGQRIQERFESERLSLLVMGALITTGTYMDSARVQSAHHRILRDRCAQIRCL